MEPEKIVEKTSSELLDEYIKMLEEQEMFEFAYLAQKIKCKLVEEDYEDYVKYN